MSIGDKRKSKYTYTSLINVNAWKRVQKETQGSTKSVTSGQWEEDCGAEYEKTPVFIF